VIIGTAQGGVQDIGKNIIKMIFEVPALPSTI